MIEEQNLNKVYQNLHFNEEDWSGHHFQECNFLNSTLSLVKLDQTKFQSVKFKNCRLIGLTFFNLNKTLLTIDFESSKLIHCNFSNLNLTQTSFQDCMLQECYFNETNLTKTNFQYARLPGTVFHQTNCTHANFIGAKDYLIDPTNNKLKKAKFSFPEVTNLLHFFEITIQNS